MIIPELIGPLPLVKSLRICEHSLPYQTDILYKYNVNWSKTVKKTIAEGVRARENDACFKSTCARLSQNHVICQFDGFGNGI